LAQAKAALGDLSCIDKLVKLGASDFIVDVLGKEKGTHARFAVGSSSLPLGSTVEIEA